MKWKHWVLPLALLSLAACAQQPVQVVAQQTDTSTNEPAEDDAISVLDNESGALPNLELTDELLYRFLVAEIAGQRGNLPLASQSYLDLAKQTRDLRLVQRATEIALYARQPQIALEGGVLWIELSPNSWRARQIVSSILINGGHPEDARPHLEQLLASSGEHIGHSFMQVNGMFARYPDKATVLVIVKDLAKGYDQVPEARYAVAQAAYWANENKLALDEVRAALKLQPEWELAVVFQGQILMRTSNEAAADYFRQYLKAYPKSKEVRLNLARLLTSDKQYEPARAEFQRLLDEFPDNPDVTLAIALLSLRLHDFDGAETQFKRLLDIGYREPDAVRYYLGQLNESRKRYDESLQWYGSVVAAAPQYLAAQAKYAVILARQGKVAEARELLHSMTPQNNQQRVQLIQAEAQILRERFAYREAFDFLAQSLEKLPNHPDLMYDYAMSAEKIERLDLLESTLRKLIQLQPENAHAYNGLGYTLADRTDRYQEALDLIQKALQLSPEDSAIIDSMGWVQYRLGNIKESAQYLRRAFDQDPDPEIAAHLGEVLWAQGQRQVAEKIWRDSLKDNPDHPVLLNVLKKFLP